MADLVNTITMNSITRISIEPASPSIWLAKSDGMRRGLQMLMVRIGSVDTRPSDMAGEKGVANQYMPPTW